MVNFLLYGASLLVLGVVLYRLILRALRRALFDYDRRNLARRMREVHFRARLALEDYEDYERFYGNRPFDTWDLLIDRCISSGFLWKKPRILMAPGGELDKERLAALHTMLTATSLRRLSTEEILERSTNRGG